MKLTDVESALVTLIDWLLDGIDYERDTAAPPALVARTLAAAVSGLRDLRGRPH